MQQMTEPLVVVVAVAAADTVNNADRFGFGDAVRNTISPLVGPCGIAQPFKFETGEDVLQPSVARIALARRASNRSNPVYRMMLPTVTVNVLFCFAQNQSHLSGE